MLQQANKDVSNHGVPKKHAAAGWPTLPMKEILKEHAAAGLFQLHIILASLEVYREYILYSLL